MDYDDFKFCDFQDQDLPENLGWLPLIWLTQSTHSKMVWQRQIGVPANACTRVCWCVLYLSGHATIEESRLRGASGWLWQGQAWAPRGGTRFISDIFPDVVHWYLTSEHLLSMSVSRYHVPISISDTIELRIAYKRVSPSRVKKFIQVLKHTYFKALNFGVIISAMHQLFISLHREHLLTTI